MADVTGASLAPIYSRLNSAPNYHPLEADTFADWSLEAGDMVTVTRDNSSYESPVHSSTVTWKKGAQVSISSTGNESREAISKVSNKKYTSGSGSLRSTENAYYAIETSYNDMKSGLILASSSASLYVEQAYGRMKAGLDLTSSSAALYVDNKYTQMSAGLKLTSSSAALYVDSKYNQMSSGLRLTSSSAALYVDNKYAQMSAGLRLTSSSAALYVNSKYDQMKSGLFLTSSSAALYVNSKYDQMKSGLDLTSSSAALYVNSKYDQMKSGLSLTSSSAALYASSATNAAKIVARINESSGQSEIEINADKIYQLGQTIANTIDANYISTKIASLASVNVQSLTSERGGVSVYSVGTTNFTQGGVSCYVPNGIWALQIVQNGNNYTLQRQRFNDSGWTDVGTFSRAVASWTMGWSSGTFTAKANPQNQSCSTTIVQGTPSWDNKTVTIPIEAYDSDNPGYQYATGRNVVATYSGADVSNLGIYDVNSNLVSSQTLNRGSSLDMWSGYWDGSRWVWGSKVTISAQGNPSYNYSLKCTGASQQGGVVTYTFTTSGGGPFSTGSNYGFWRA